jgi:hypothetical protein
VKRARPIKNSTVGDFRDNVRDARAKSEDLLDKGSITKLHFWPKTFRINFRPQNVDKVPHKNIDIYIYLNIVENNVGF